MKGWFWGWLGQPAVNDNPLAPEHILPAIMDKVLTNQIESIWFEDGRIMCRNTRDRDPQYHVWWLKEER